MNPESYTYENLLAIDKNLLCKICSKPLLEPVIISNGERICRACIDPNSTPEHSIEVINEVILNSILNSLLVRCNRCEKSNIKRENITDHQENYCSKRIVPCSAVNLKCCWKGTFDQLDQHKAECIFENFRPVLEDAISTKTEMEKYAISYSQQQRKIQEMSEKIEQIQTKNNNFTSIFKFLNQNQSKIEKRMDEIQRDVQEIRTSIENLKKDFSASIEINQNRDIPPTRNMLNVEEENLRKQVQQLLQKDAEVEVEFSSMRTESEERNVQDDIPDRQQTDTTDRTLTNKKYLENLLKKTDSGYSLNAERIVLEDEEISYIIEHIFSSYQCEKILFNTNRLSKNSINMIVDDLMSKKRRFQEVLVVNNGVTDVEVFKFAQAIGSFDSSVEWLDLQSNKITDIGAQHLANMLKENIQLRFLFLSANQIGDLGFRSLAHALLNHNNTLEYLHLSFNERITDAIVSDLIQLLSINKTLKMVSVNDCGLTDVGKATLRNFAETRLNCNSRYLEV